MSGGRGPLLVLQAAVAKAHNRCMPVQAWVGGMGRLGWGPLLISGLPSLNLPWRRWLGLTAFLRVLRRKQARYSELLGMLRELAEAPGLREAARQLAEAVAPARNSVFDTILY